MYVYVNVCVCICVCVCVLYFFFSLGKGMYFEALFMVAIASRKKAKNQLSAKEGRLCGILILQVHLHT